MIKAILLDIEGTTTPIDFVHETLFPYSKQRISQFVERHFSELQKEVSELVDESLHDESFTGSVNGSDPRSVSAYLEHLIDSDRKSTPLKALQGMIWKEGYESGELKSIVFDDVRPAFERWTSDGKKIAIFSSGSVLAQQLLFRYTNHGDLTPFISAYFDTTTGPKRNAESYLKIASDLNTNPDHMFFISDDAGEISAATVARLPSALCIRPGNPPVPPNCHVIYINSFEAGPSIGLE
jgi:enolase-phosphatase E1